MTSELLVTMTLDEIGSQIRSAEQRLRARAGVDPALEERSTRVATRGAGARLVILAAVCLLLMGGIVVAATTGRLDFVPAIWQQDQEHPDASEVQALPSMSVFAAPATAADRLPARQQALAESLNRASGVPEKLLPGNVETIKSRLLLADAGHSHASFYAYPSAKGKVCWDSGCVGGFNRSTHPVVWVASATRNFRQVRGLAPDWVRAVELGGGDGTRAAATMGRNFFFYEQPASQSPPTTLMVTLDGGTQIDIPLPAFPG